ncbi:MAG: PDZ domain-containing protein [Gammaproteobacteria bacterium]|nr:PDZ domain-containing protein [Gammaproteobacteria bacterium]
MQQHSVHYRVVPADPAAHLFEIQLTVINPVATGQIFSLPAWLPGSYMIRDFARNIVTIKAECAGQPVALTKLDKQSWQAVPCHGALILKYTVYAWDLSVRSAHFDQSHAFFNGSSLFLRVHEQDDKPCSVELLRPKGREYKPWRVATTLPLNGAALWGFGGYQANDYDELIDHPVEIADFTLIEFEVGGTPHAMTISGKHYADNGRLAVDLKKICETQVALFGELPPMARYLFLVLTVDEGYGGLEHRHSTALITARDDLPQRGETVINNGYRRFLGLCSHEYFHTWNVKRIKPAAYLPYNLQAESHTPLLWFFEGVTSYYDDLLLLRSGCIDRTGYLELLGQQITRLLRTPGRHHQSVSESSFDAWTKLYKADENAANATISYYNKGALIALCLDLTIRRESGGQLSLDDVMRALWQLHGKPLIGVTSEGLEQFIEETTGVNLKAFFALALRTAQELPLSELLGGFGITLNLRPSEGAEDKGGRPGNGKTPPYYTGMRLAADPVGAKASVVLNHSPAHQAGISAGDLVMAVDGMKTDNSRLDKQLSRFQPGDRVTLHGFRRDLLQQWQLTITTPVADTAWLSVAHEQQTGNWLPHQEDGEK